MENCILAGHLKDHNYWRRRRISTRQADGARKPKACGKDRCCSKDQVVNLTPRPQRCVSTVSLPQRRRRSPVSRPSRPSVQPPEMLAPRSAISPADLPEASNMPPSPQQCSANNKLSSSSDGPLKIHNRSVEEYQQIYHEVVDTMMRYKNGRPRPYSLDLGRRIKQKLWERLNRPMLTTSVNEDGLVQVDMLYGQGVNPPIYDIYALDEPDPRQPQSKRAKNEN